MQLTCYDSYPGHCLQDVAYAVGHLPAAHAPVLSIAAYTMEYPCSGSGAAACTEPPHRGDEWIVFGMRNESRSAMWITDEMATRSFRLEANVAPVASIDPASSSYALICGAIPVETCTAVAAGAVASNETPATVQVMPGTVSPYRVTFTYPDGSGTSVDVERDPSWEIGWSPLQSAPAPPPTEHAGGRLQSRG